MSVVGVDSTANEGRRLEGTEGGRACIGAGAGPDVDTGPDTGCVSDGPE